MADEQVTQTGDQANVDTTQPQSLGWRAGLPDDLKNNEAFTPYKTVGDLGKVHIETVGKVKELEGKLATAIIKPGEKATPEEQVAYRLAMGVPEKSDDYSFPKPEGVELSDKLVGWAKGVFHEVGMPKDMAEKVGAKWNEYWMAEAKAMEKAEADLAKENEGKFRAEFKSDDEYKVGMELTKRFWEKVTQTKFDEVYKDVEAWKIPMFMRFIFNAAKSTGEDFSPKGEFNKGGEPLHKTIYDIPPPNFSG